MKKGETVIKNSSVLRGLMERRFHPLLIDIILEIVDKYGIRMSESYRLPRHKGDLHSTSPVRAIDISFWVYTETIAINIRDYINSKWEYNPGKSEKPVALIHKVKGGVFHFHIQVSNNTRLRVF